MFVCIYERESVCVCVCICVYGVSQVALVVKNPPTNEET